MVTLSEKCHQANALGTPCECIGFSQTRTEMRRGACANHGMIDVQISSIGERNMVPRACHMSSIAKRSRGLIPRFLFHAVSNRKVALSMLAALVTWTHPPSTARMT